MGASGDFDCASDRCPSSSFSFSSSFFFFFFFLSFSLFLLSFQATGNTNRSTSPKPTTLFGHGLPETAALVFPAGKNGPGRPDVFVGQFHFIRTEGLAGGRRNTTDCIEQCSSDDVAANCPNAGLWRDGTRMRCCDEAAEIRKRAYIRGGFHRGAVPSACHALPAVSMKPKRYYLKYTVEWTPDVDNVEPVYLSHLRAPDCEYFFDLQATAAGSPHSSVAKAWTAPHDIEVLAAMPHLHNGGVNITLALDGKLICTMFPVLGRRKGVLGDELGYITGGRACHDDVGKLHGFVVKKGQVLEMTAFYRTAVDDDDPTLPMLPGGGHSAAMAYVQMAWRRWSPDAFPLKYT